MPRIRSRISATIYIENQKKVKRQPLVLFIMLVLR